MKTLLNARLRRFAASAGQAALLLTLVSSAAQAQINAGELKPQPDVPFTMTQVATFNLPWRLAFLPDGRMLVTEKVGPVWLVTQQGEKTQVANVPAVLAQGQGGMLGVFVSPHYATDHNVYLTYSEPGDVAGASGLALARARLNLDGSTPSLEGLQVLWHDMPKGRGGQFGA
jgi:aldose sugar dehydrogenase